MTARSVAVFDLCGVLIEWDPRLLYRKLFDDEAAMELFLARVCSEDWNLEHDAGRPLDECIDELIAKHPQEADLISAWRDRFAEMMRPIDDSIEILEELHRRGTPLYSLSNFGADTFELTYSLFPFLEYFRGTTISGRVGLLKPDPRIYRRLIDDHDLDASRILFIDDNLANVESARNLGIHAIQFKGASDLRQELACAGLL